MVKWNLSQFYMSHGHQVAREKAYWWEGIFDLILLGAVWPHIAGCGVACGIDWVVGVSRSENHRIWCPQKKNWHLKHIKILACSVCYENLFIRDLAVIISKELDHHHVHPLSLFESETRAVSSISLRCLDLGSEFEMLRLGE